MPEATLKLEPCPWCGPEGDPYLLSQLAFQVVCRRCGSRGPVEAGAGSAEKWNALATRNVNWRAVERPAGTIPVAVTWEAFAVIYVEAPSYEAAVELVAEADVPLPWESAEEGDGEAHETQVLTEEHLAHLLL